MNLEDAIKKNRERHIASREKHANHVAKVFKDTPMSKESAEHHGKFLKDLSRRKALLKAKN